MPLAGRRERWLGRRRPPWQMEPAWPREGHHLALTSPTQCMQVLCWDLVRGRLA